MAEQNLSVDIKIKADTSGAKEATKAIDGLTDAIEEQAVAEKELVQETEKVVVEEKKLVEVEREATTAVVGVTHAFKDQEKVAEMLGAGLRKTSLATAELAKATTHAKEQAQQFISANAYGKFDDTLAKAHDAMKRTTVSANGTAQATKEVGKANSNSAMGVLALSNAFQDAQYGMAGMINNIPMMVTGMGLGMGVAGAVQAAAVGVQILTKNFDIFGTEAAAAAKEATATANEATALANSTQRAADAASEAAKKHEELSNALKKTEGDYKAVSKASDEAIESAKRLQDIETKRGDLQSELAMAEIDAMAAGGQISKEDAAARREGVRAQRAARAAALEEKAMEAAAKAEAERAAAAEAAAKEQKKILDEKLKEGSDAGLMTEKQRKAAQESLEAFEKEADAAKKRAEDEKRSLDLMKAAATSTTYAIGGKGGEMLENSEFGKTRQQRIDIEKANETEQRNRAQQMRQALIDDAAARARTGAQSKEEFQSRREGALTKLGEYESEADRARRQAGIIGGNLGLARETTAVRAKIAAITQTSAAAASAQSGYGIGFVGPVPPQGFAVDQKEAEKAAKEADSANRSNTASTIKIIRALANELKLTKEQLSALNGVVEDIRTTK